MLVLQLAHQITALPDLLSTLGGVAGGVLAGSEGTIEREKMSRLSQTDADDELLRVAGLELERRGDMPLHQLSGAHRSFLEIASRQKQSGGHPFPVCMVALCAIARKLFTRARGTVMWKPDGLLLWREQWSGHTLIEPVRLAAEVFSCLQEDGDLAWQVRLDQGRCESEAPFSDPIIPAVADRDVLQLGTCGLVEPHRHASLSRLSTHAWLGVLYGTEPIDPRIDDDQLSPTPLYSRIRQARALCRAIDALLDQVEAAQAGRCERAYEDACQASWFAIRGDFLPGAPETLPLSQGLMPHRSIGGEGPPSRLLAVDRRRMRRCMVAIAGHACTEPPAVLGLALHALLLCRSQVEGRLTQPAQLSRGLDRFKHRYVDHPLSRSFQVPWPDHWQQAWRVGCVRQLELKITPSSINQEANNLVSGLHEVDFLSCDDDHSYPRVPWLSALSSQTTAATRLTEADSTRQRPGVRLHVHFLREPEPDDRAGSPGPFFPRPRWHVLRAKLVNQAEDVCAALRMQHVAPLIAAIDIASDELAAPAEVFAPAFAFLRRPSAERRAHTSSVIPRSRLAPEDHDAPAISVHAGEEFEHLISGIRHIDEHLQFLHLRAGDRLGHALAIGVEPSNWRLATGGWINTSKQTRLDDLVWLDHQLGRFPPWSHLCLQLRNEISDLSTEIYGRSFSMTDLHSAWALREIDPLGADTSGITTGTSTTSVPIGRAHGGEREAGDSPFGLDGWARLRLQGRERLKSATSDARELWTRYTFESDVRARGAARAYYKLDPALDEPIRAVQNCFIRELASADIYIEACPSSNLAIAGLGRIANHPVFRWMPVRPNERLSELSVQVVIGSDDPAIFHTELIHEYAILAEAARDRGHSRAEVRDWLDALRKNAESAAFRLRA